MFTKRAVVIAAALFLSDPSLGMEDTDLEKDVRYSRLKKEEKDFSSNIVNNININDKNQKLKNFYEIFNNYRTTPELERKVDKHNYNCANFSFINSQGHFIFSESIGY